MVAKYWNESKYHITLMVGKYSNESKYHTNGREIQEQM